MCGLAVVMSFDNHPVDPLVLQRMTDVLKHRGPDDEGILVRGPVGFGFRRLAILDLTPAGRQPMVTPDGRFAIVFNGEIYNYIELRTELIQLGHQFLTSSDTEVLLAAYRQWGRDCASRFNGMWAFAIHDRKTGTVLISRDRFGVKPLYRFRTDSRLVLGSEIKAIFASGLGPESRTNWPVAANFLIRGRLDNSLETFYAGIDQIPPGVTIEVSADGRESVHRFWSLPAVVRKTPEDPVGRFRHLLEDAVRLRMRSDVPVGVCLSGGVDSNAIISLMADLWPPETPNRLQAFSYLPDEFGERVYVRETIARTGAELNQLTIAPKQLLDVLPQALWHYEEPVHSPTPLIGFELMRLAKSRGVTVVLNGQGADEVNAGYYPYFSQYWSSLLAEGRIRRAWHEVRAYSDGHHISPQALFVSAARRALTLWARRLPGYAHARRRRRLRVPRASFFNVDLIRRLPDEDDPPVDLLGTLKHAVQVRPLPTYLRVEDRNSMAHGVEARLPFLDYRLVSLAFELPAEWKLRGPWNKFVLREAAKGIVAEVVRTRVDKMGFPTPSRAWLAGPWHDAIRDLLAARPLMECGIVNRRAIDQALEAHRNGDADVTGPLFHMAQFSVWLQQAMAWRAGDHVA